MIAAEPFETERDATGWLGSVRRRAAADDEIEAALQFVNRVVRTHRLAAHDPYENELSRAGAHRIRLGYGTGDQVADGAWSEARIVPTGRGAGRQSRLDPSSAMAEMLGGRRPEYAGDDLLLRARLDLDQGRVRQAAIQVHAAARTLAAEEIDPDQGEDWHKRARAIETAALDDDLGPEDLAELEELQRLMERAARRRMHR